MRLTTQGCSCPKAAVFAMGETAFSKLHPQIVPCALGLGRQASGQVSSSLRLPLGSPPPRAVAAKARPALPGPAAPAQPRRDGL